MVSFSITMASSSLNASESLMSHCYIHFVHNSKSFRVCFPVFGSCSLGHKTVWKHWSGFSLQEVQEFMTPVKGNPQMSCLTSAHSRLTPSPTAHRSVHFIHQPPLLLPLAFLNSISLYSNSVWHDTMFLHFNDFNDSIFSVYFCQLQSYSQFNTDPFVIISEKINCFYTIILVESHRVRLRFIQVGKIKTFWCGRVLGLNSVVSQSEVRSCSVVWW